MAYTKLCSGCGCIQSYSRKDALNASIKYDIKCVHCGCAGNGWGRRLSDEAKLKISVSNKGRLTGDNNPAKRQDVRDKISKNRTGKLLGVKLSSDMKSRLSLAHSGSKNHFYGKCHTEESKKLMRIAALKKLEELGIPNNSDIGADAFFKSMNALGFNFKPTRFLEIGYIADGYDKEKHIWCEFDTPHHKSVRYQVKDLIRQNNIIHYFESINRPLLGFVRISADSDGKVLGTKRVYRNATATTNT